MYLRNYGLGKPCFGKCIKMLVSEDLSTSNMLSGLKPCLNMHNSIFNRFIDTNEIYSEKFSLSDM